MSACPCPSPIFGKEGWSLAWGLFFLRFHPLRTPIWKRLLHGELTFLTCELKPLCSVAHGFAVKRGLTICVDRQQNEDVP